jgi:hypothetical protein
MGTTFLRFGIGLLIVIAFVLVIMSAQGIGQSVGHGLTEWGIR